MGHSSKRIIVLTRDIREPIFSLPVRTLKKGHVLTQEEGNSLQGMTSILFRNQISWHLDLGLPASRTVGNGNMVKYFLEWPSARNFLMLFPWIAN